MNEYQRQAYLSALGVENYMPRWQLPFAPESVVCELPISAEIFAQNLSARERPAQSASEISNIILGSDRQASNSPIPVAEVLLNFGEEKPKIKNPEVSRTESVKSPSKTISPFSLSIWRPCTGMLIIDSRHTRLALPTELLLHNLMRALLGHDVSLGREEILSWPLVESRAVAGGFDEAQSALEVWLEVELEQRPAQKLLIMGENAAQFFLPKDKNYIDLQFQSFFFSTPSVTATVAPSLVELLQHPLLKRDLWLAMQSWRNPD